MRSSILKINIIVIAIVRNVIVSSIDSLERLIAKLARQRKEKEVNSYFYSIMNLWKTNCNHSIHLECLIWELAISSDVCWLSFGNHIIPFTHWNVTRLIISSDELHFPWGMTSSDMMMRMTPVELLVNHSSNTSRM